MIIEGEGGRRGLNTLLGSPYLLNSSSVTKHTCPSARGYPQSLPMRPRSSFSVLSEHGQRQPPRHLQAIDIHSKQSSLKLVKIK